MSKKKTATYCLVVDADVVRAAGTLEATSDRSIRCREALHAIRSICHRIAWSAEILAEWEKHAAYSEFGSAWLVSMFQLDNKVRPVKPPASDLAEQIEACEFDAGVKAILRKDRHLVEAAWATDSRIVSLDATARFHYAALAGTVDELKPILWVNPETDEDAVKWVEAGAPKQKKYRLR